MKFIKIVHPITDQLISLTLSKDENEIRNIISSKIGVGQRDLLGVKDKYGNYYTLASLAYNNRLNNDFSDFYQILLTAKNFKNGDIVNNNNFSNANNVNNNFGNTLHNRAHSTFQQNGNFEINNNIFDRNSHCINNSNNNNNHSIDRNNYNNFINYNNISSIHSNNYSNNSINNNINNITFSHNTNRLYSEEFKQKLDFDETEKHQAIQSVDELSNINYNNYIEKLNSRSNSPKTISNEYQKLKSTFIRKRNYSHDLESPMNKLTKINLNNNSFSGNIMNSVSGSAKKKNNTSLNLELINSNLSNSSFFHKDSTEQDIYHINNTNNSSLNSFLNDSLKDIEEKYRILSNELFRKGYFSEKNFNKLKLLILTKNQEVFSIFSIYIKGIIDIKTLLANLKIIFIAQDEKQNSVANNVNNNIKLSPEKENEIKKFLNNLHPNYIDDMNDIDYFFKLVDNKNENLIASYEVYLLDGDIENFLDTLTRLIKAKYSNNLNNTLNSSAAFNSMNSSIGGKSISQPHSVSHTRNPSATKYQVSMLSEIEEESSQKPTTRQLSSNATSNIVKDSLFKSSGSFIPSNKDSNKNSDKNNNTNNNINNNTNNNINNNNNTNNNTNTNYNNINSNNNGDTNNINSNINNNISSINNISNISSNNNTSSNNNSPVQIPKVNIKKMTDFNNFKQEIDHLLNKIDRCIFDYCFKSSQSDIEYLLNLKVILNDKEFFYQLVKGYLSNYFFKNILSFIEDQRTKEIFKEYLKKKERDKDKEVLILFQKFSDSCDINSFKETLQYYFNSKYGEIFSPKKSEKKVEERNWWESTQDIFYHVKKQKYLNFEELEKFLNLLREKNPKIIEIIKEIKSTKDVTKPIQENIKNILENKDSQESNNQESSNQEINNQGIQKENKGRKESKENLSEFQVTLNDFFEKKLIDSVQYYFASQRYVLKDQIIMSAWESFSRNNDVEDFIESIKMFSNKLDSHYDENQHTTPTNYKEVGKGKIGNLFKSSEDITEKQIQIIDYLTNGGILVDRYVPDVKMLIAEKNTLIISAFEIFSVTLDHWDFCESLELIAEVYRKNGDRDHNYQKQSSKDEGQDEMNKLIEDFIKKYKLQINEREKLWKLFRIKDQTLFTAIDSYGRHKDKEDLEETIGLLLNKS